MNEINDLLVGSTGFVGGNINKYHSFSGKCHSINVHEFYGTRPKLCVYAGVPAAMYIANRDPDADLQIMINARENIRKIAPERIVLISSVAVYSNQKKVDENTPIVFDGLSAYGRNRLQLEKWIREDRPDAHIIRLPAIYGEGLKKNFLFDLHAIVPSMLTEEKYFALSKDSKIISDSYAPFKNGYYKLKEIIDYVRLRSFYENSSFNALSFTDSRSRFQFYHLNRLWNDICITLKNGFPTVNLPTAPVSAKEVYEYVTGRDDWENELSTDPFDYDIMSIHAPSFGGHDGYLQTKEDELSEIKLFIEKWE